MPVCIASLTWHTHARCTVTLSNQARVCPRTAMPSTSEYRADLRHALCACAGKDADELCDELAMLVADRAMAPWRGPGDVPSYRAMERALRLSIAAVVTETESVRAADRARNAIAATMFTARRLAAMAADAADSGPQAITALRRAAKKAKRAHEITTSRGRLREMRASHVASRDATARLDDALAHLAANQASPVAPRLVRDAFVRFCENESSIMHATIRGALDSFDERTNYACDVPRLRESNATSMVQRLRDIADTLEAAQPRKPSRKRSLDMSRT